MEPRGACIEVLANSEAVQHYVTQGVTPDYQLLAELSGAGVDFTACNNALVGLGIQSNQLPEFVHIVPVGVLELAEKQQQGYAYIKP